MKPTAINIVGGDDASGVSVYYEIADYLDFAFLVEEVADGRPEEEVRHDLAKSILDFSLEFITAANEFQRGLAEKLKLKEFVY